MKLMNWAGLSDFLTVLTVQWLTVQSNVQLNCHLISGMRSNEISSGYQCLYSVSQWTLSSIASEISQHSPERGRRQHHYKSGAILWLVQKSDARTLSTKADRVSDHRHFATF